LQRLLGYVSQIEGSGVIYASGMGRQGIIPGRHGGTINYFLGVKMKKLIAAICFMFALAPLAQAQDKAAPAAEKKAAPAVEKKGPPAAEKKGPPAAEKKGPPAAEKKGAAAGEKKAAAKAKKEPTEKQKAQRAKMKSCSADAKGKNLKGKERSQFMSGCLKG
jgi:hypothetical protein